MRILITATAPTAGDHGQRALAYATGLQNRGHEVLLAHCESDNLARSAGRTDIPRRAVTIRAGSESPGIGLLGLHRILRGFLPDVVLVDSAGAALSSAASSPRTPVLLALERRDGSRGRFELAMRASRARLHTTSHIPRPT